MLTAITNPCVRDMRADDIPSLLKLQQEKQHGQNQRRFMSAHRLTRYTIGQAYENPHCWGLIHTNNNKIIGYMACTLCLKASSLIIQELVTKKQCEVMSATILLRELAKTEEVKRAIAESRLTTMYLKEEEYETMAAIRNVFGFEYRHRKSNGYRALEIPSLFDL